MSEEAPRESREHGSTATRRRFLVWLGASLTAAASALLALPFARYLLGPALRRQARRAWISLGPAADFSEGRTRLATYRNPFAVDWDGSTAELACWVRRIERERFQVFSVHCTHLGCPVRWFAESGLFMCPCHGGVFYEDGRRAAGPPPRGLYEYAYRVRDGELEVRGGHIPTLSEPL
jgi:menaquinol-cytochrome c reductase iron-sulfur subunit